MQEPPFVIAVKTSSHLITCSFQETLSGLRSSGAWTRSHPADKTLRRKTQISHRPHKPTSRQRHCGSVSSHTSFAESWQEWRLNHAIVERLGDTVIIRQCLVVYVHQSALQFPDLTLETEKENSVGCFTTVLIFLSFFFKDLTWLCERVMGVSNTVHMMLSKQGGVVRDPSYLKKWLRFSGSMERTSMFEMCMDWPVEVARASNETQFQSLFAS